MAQPGIKHSRIFRVLALVLSLLLLAALPGCSSGYKVTGEIEEGPLVIWQSPGVTQYMQRGGKIADLYYEYSDDIKLVPFDTDQEFQTALSQKLMTDECPDVILAYGNEVSPKSLAGDSFADLNLFWDYQDATEFEINEDDKIAGLVTDLQRKDILPAVLNLCTIGDKLAAMPLKFNTFFYEISAENDKKSLGLLKEGITLK